MSQSSYYIGIDWGGTRIKIGAVSVEGKVMSCDFLDTPQCCEIEEVVNALLERTELMIQNEGGLPLGIGIGLTGVVNPKQGVVLLPGKVKGLEGYPVVSRFADRFRVPVLAHNDGALAMYAEKYAGLAQRVNWAVTITIGTGIGSGVMLDGKILDDPHFMFGSQIGHFVINSGNDQLCLTGSRGTGEMSCSASALAIAVRSGLQRGIPSTLAEKYRENPFLIDFKTIIEEGVKQGDLLCCDELARWTKQLGWLLVNAVHAYSPELIVLSGGATLASEYFLNNLQEQMNRHIFRYPRGERVPILVSEMAEYSGVLGAAMMMKVKKEQDL